MIFTLLIEPFRASMVNIFTHRPDVAIPKWPPARDHREKIVKISDNYLQ
jgi:hypothetical protein